MDFLTQYSEAAKTSVGFFWKSGWAFVLGYAVSAAIQTFVPKRNLTRFMGKADARSISLSTLFGAISSSCSFAALATARSLFLKGAHFVAAVAFMFASTNLVIELGILIYIFLGWEYVIAEIIGGLVLIAISSLLIRWAYPRKWIEEARKKVEAESGGTEDDFDWRKRIRSKTGWLRVGHKFVHKWKMAWEDILIGFTIAGFVAVFVPDTFWQAVFLQNLEGEAPAFLLRLENAFIAPFVAALTFIGSMGNIPLATVLAGSGVTFAGIMGFIYSDLIVPPLVDMNRKYYGIKVALYIVGVMLVSIVSTALLLNYGFEALGVMPRHKQVMGEMTQFRIDYTFWFNLFFAAVAAVLVWAYYRFKKLKDMPGTFSLGNITLKRAIVYACVIIVTVGLALFFVQ